MRPNSVEQNYSNKLGKRKHSDNARFSSSIQNGRGKIVTNSATLIRPAAPGIYSQEMSVKGEGEPAWFKNNRDHIYSSGSDYNSVVRNQQEPSFVDSYEKMDPNYGNLQ